jgi:hypothetical protein
MIRSDDDYGTFVRINTIKLVRVSMSVIIAFVVDVYFVDVLGSVSDYSGT